MNHLLIHVPHASTYIPAAYRRTSLLPPEELEAENLFLCDTGILELIPPALAANALSFPYSRMFCDVERFRDGTEPMERYGMGFIYTHDTKGREVFRPTDAHRQIVSQVYDAHHAELDRRAAAILREHGRCVIIDLHSFSDEMVDRMFGRKGCPDVCIGTEPDYYSEELVCGIEKVCHGLGLSTARNFPYAGSMVPNRYYGKKDTGIVSVMLEINKRVLGFDHFQGYDNDYNDIDFSFKIKVE